MICRSDGFQINVVFFSYFGTCQFMYCHTITCFIILTIAQRFYTIRTSMRGSIPHSPWLYVIIVIVYIHYNKKCINILDI